MSIKVQETKAKLMTREEGQTLQSENATLRAENEALRGTIQELKTQNEALKKRLDVLEQRPKERPNLWKVLLANILLAGLIALIVHYVFPSLQPVCVPSGVGTVGWTLIFLGGIHLIILMIRGTVQKTEPDSGMVKTPVVEIPINTLIPLASLIQPESLSRLSLVSAVGALVVGVIILSPISPIRSSEAVPIVRTFNIGRRNEVPSVGSGEVITLSVAEQVYVKADVMDPEGIFCEWLAQFGDLEPGEGCSTYYLAPRTVGRDTLHVQVLSQCKTQQASANLHINVIDPDSP